MFWYSREVAVVNDILHISKQLKRTGCGMWGMPAVSAPQRQRQEVEEFKVSLGLHRDFQPRMGYKRLYLKTTTIIIIIVSAGD